MFTIVEFVDQVEDENLYRRLKVSAAFPMTDAEARALGTRPDESADAREPVLSVSVVHAVSGGVTLNCRVERIAEWDALLAAHRRELRGAVRPRPVQVAERIHTE